MSANLQQPCFMDAGFFSCLCHELRSSVQLIEGFGDLLLNEEPMTPGQRSKVEVIMRNGNYLLMLLRDLEELARLGDGRISFAMTRVALGEVARECVEHVTGIAVKRQVMVLMDSPENTFPQVEGDPLRLRQVLINLLTNAIKYNRQRGEVRVFWENREDGKVRVKVRDNGFGIAREQWSEVFTPFARLGLERSDILGSGIGLAIAKEMVERMGGSIGFESQLGEGSTFWIDLPSPTKSSPEPDFLGLTTRLGRIPNAPELSPEMAWAVT